MPTIEPRRFLVFILCSLSGTACQETVTPAGTDAGTITSSTAPDAPTTTPDTPTTAPGSSTVVPDGEETTTSTGDVGTTSSGAGTMVGAPWCGDGVVDANEECDESLAANNDNGFCKTNCMLNVCGDGKLFVGWELCDEGEANSDAYGSLCDSQCEPGARCGDNKLQPEFESCDLGLNNGGLKGDEQGILCDATCRAQQLRGFVTKQFFSGDLGGPFGADAKCREAAKAAGLPEPERFYAYLSTGDIDALTPFEKVATSWPYVLVTGKKFADNFAALIEAGPLGEGISITEDGTPLYNANVATNTKPGGIHFSDDQHCQSWTTDDGAIKARVGINAIPEDAPEWADWKNTLAWTGAFSRQCSKIEFHLYCLEI